MPQEFSFDIVSKTDMQEVANAIQQAQKELAQRFDFSVETIRFFSLLLYLVFSELPGASLLEKTRFQLNDPLQKTLLSLAGVCDFSRERLLLFG